MGSPAGQPMPAQHSASQSGLRRARAGLPATALRGWEAEVVVRGHPTVAHGSPTQPWLCHQTCVLEWGPQTFPVKPEVTDFGFAGQTVSATTIQPKRGQRPHEKGRVGCVPPE